MTMIPSGQQTLHVIFKTHLDVGFTDLAGTIVRQYLESFIPQAIAVARTLRESLPVVEQELGDTWIHGIGTDPGKMAVFRALCRKLDDWQTAGRGTDVQAFARRLLLVPEHTWGLDTKTHLGDYVNYARANFEAGLAGDGVPRVARRSAGAGAVD